MVVTDLAQALHELDGRRDETALALQRLQDDGRHGIGGAGLLEQVLYAGQGVLDDLCFGALAAVQVGEVGAEDAVHQRAHAGGVGLLGGHGHGQHGAAVEGTGEDDDVGAAGVSLGDLDGVLVGLGTGVGEEDLLALALHGDDLGQLLGQRHVPLVGDDVEHAVEVLVGLGLDGLDDLRVGEADVQHAHAADPVHEDVAVHVLDHGALACFNGDGVSTADGAGDGSGAAVDDLLGLGAGQGTGDDLRKSSAQHKNQFLSQ